MFGASDTVVALGQDGLVANVLKYLDGQWLIGVNPDVERWEGVLLPFEVGHLESVVLETFERRRPIRHVTMAQVTLNTGEVLYGVNDLFIGPRSHTSARYEIRIGEHAENQSSSGIIVSTGLGSTGWMRSIVTGAACIATSLSGEHGIGRHGRGQNGADHATRGHEWDADYLRYAVREPWPSRTSGATITFGNVTSSEPLTVISKMPEDGRGGGVVRVSLGPDLEIANETSLDLIALQDALECLRQIAPRQSEVVEMRFFGGLTHEEIADLLDVSTMTVKRDFAMARRFLFYEMRREGASESPRDDVSESRRDVH